MEKTIFEQMGGTYAQAGDYNSPNHKNMLQSNPYCTPQVKSSRYRSIKSVVAALFNIYFSS